MMTAIAYKLFISSLVYTGTYTISELTGADKNEAKIYATDTALLSLVVLLILF